jgi:polyribonucleotide nucleotidyltransferase
VLINPLNSQIGETFEYQSFVAGTLDRINMVELEGIDADEQNVVAGFELAQKEINKLIEFQAKIVKEIGKPKAQVKLASEDESLKTTPATKAEWAFMKY